ncbi:MAG TPA: PilZ domain-containing protein [Candidatus Angelobacter sp.]|nr:PilZ domain-containing protein [Candidatus Angelobacter sp.]
MRPLTAADPLQFEFLVVCGDVSAYRSITGSLQAMNGAVNYTSTAATARAYIQRRKIDGIFLDFNVGGTLELVRMIRQGGSNRFAVIFGCADEMEDSSQLLAAGVNFVLRKPLTAIVIEQALKTATRIMESERKRYLRHQLVVPVLIRLREKEQKATTANISKGGMAVRCRHPYEPGDTISFTFDLPMGEISGRGAVAWANTEGFMGIKFYLLGDNDKQRLFTWLERHMPSTS